MLELDRFTVLDAVRGTTLLAPTTLACERGTVTLLTGPVGGGTSTLLAALAGSLRSDCLTEGTVRLGGVDLTAAGQPDGETLVATVGVNQAAVNGRESLRRLLRSHREVLGAAGSLTKPPGLAELVHLLALGAHLDRPIASSPDAVRVRAELALALIARPRLLLLDQLLGTADPSWRTSVARLVTGAARAGCVVVWADHEIEAAGSADRVMAVRDGVCGEFAPHTPPVDLPRRPGSVGPSRRIRPMIQGVADVGVDLARGLMIGLLGDNQAATGPMLTQLALATKGARGPQATIQVRGLLGRSSVGSACQTLDRRRGVPDGSTADELADVLPQVRPFEASHRHSAGERRVIETVLIALCSGDLVTLDNPTAGLDQNTARRLLHWLRKLADRQAPVVIATVDAHLVERWCDQLWEASGSAVSVRAGETREELAPLPFGA